MTSRRKRLKLTAASSIQRRATFNARCAGVTSKAYQIHFWIHASAMDRLGSFIMTAWSTGSSRRCRKRRKATWCRTAGNSLSVKYARNLTPTSLSLMEGSTGSLMLRFLKKGNSSGLNHLLLRKTPPAWSTLSCLMPSQGRLNWAEVMNQTCVWAISPWAGATPFLSTTRLSTATTWRTTYLNSARWSLQSKRLNWMLIKRKLYRSAEVWFPSLWNPWHSTTSRSQLPLKPSRYSCPSPHRLRSC